MIVIWRMVPQIQCAMDRMFCHFGPSFALYPPSLPKQLLFLILGYFLPLPPQTSQKVKILKKWKTKQNKQKKNTRRYHHFTYVYQRLWSDDVRFLRYGAWWILVFILGQFLPFYPPNSPKNQNFEKMKKKKAWRYHHFTYVYQKLGSDDVRFLRYDVWWM